MCVFNIKKKSRAYMRSYVFMFLNSSINLRSASRMGCELAIGTRPVPLRATCPFLLRGRLPFFHAVIVLFLSPYAAPSSSAPPHGQRRPLSSSRPRLQCRHPPSDQQPPEEPSKVTGVKVLPPPVSRQPKTSTLTLASLPPPPIDCRPIVRLTATPLRLHTHHAPPSASSPLHRRRHPSCELGQACEHARGSLYILERKIIIYFYKIFYMDFLGT